MNDNNLPSHEASARRRKILIISMTAGFGHLKAGEALLDYAKQNLPNIEASHVDIADIDSSFKKHTKIYDVISKKIPLVWGVGYKILNVSLFLLVFKKLNMFSYFLSSDIKNYIQKSNPDAILFTNVTPLPLFSFSFRRVFPNIKIGIVVTDYHGHAYYHFSFVDYYFVANESVKNDLIRAGVKKEKIVITGIPVSPAFFEKQNVSELKLTYGIINGLPTALLVASFKISKNDLVDLVQKLLGLKPQINVIVLTNNNQGFYNAIEKSIVSEERLSLVRWTDKMAEYMKISDVIITKAGGLTVSECLTLKKPMIMINPILGQEEYNAKFVQKNGFGQRVKNIDEIIEILPKIIYDAKNKQIDLTEPENPSKKIFQSFQ